MNSIYFEKEKIEPSKIVCVGRNYVEHIEELGNEMPSSIVLFNKPNSAISNELFYFSEDTRYESEISFLIKDKKIAGVGFGLDLTKANLQNSLKKSSHPWERAKAFDGSAVFSNFVSFNSNFKSLRSTLFINEKIVQEANYELMIHKPLDVLEEILTFMSLEDGDILMMGTPKGVGSYSVGDLFCGAIYCDDMVLVDKKWIAKEHSNH